MSLFLFAIIYRRLYVGPRGIEQILMLCTIGLMIFIEQFETFFKFLFKFGSLFDVVAMFYV